MPLHDYICASCNGISEYIVDFEERENVQTCDYCNGIASFDSRVKRFRHIGPVFADLMDIEDRLLSTKQKAAGMRIRDHRDVTKWERDNKVVACSEEEQKFAQEENRELAAQQKKTVSEGGMTAWADEVDKTDIQSSTGWSDTKYDRWKTMTDTAQKDLQNVTE